MRIHHLLCVSLLAACSGTSPPSPSTPAALAEASSTRAPADIVAVASESAQLSTLVAALEAAELVSTLQGEGPFTVFAPTDAAFAKLPAGTVESLLEPENRERLIEVLTYHVVSGKVTSDQVVRLESATTVQGSDIAISTENGGVRVDGANVIQADIEARNGVIHVIDSVILPG